MNFSFYFLHACFYLSAFIFFISRLPLTLRVPGAGRVAFSPTVLLSQWLNIKRWQIPPLCSPPSLVLSPITPLFSPLILTASFSSSCSLPHHPLFPSFSSPLSLSTSLYFPSTLFFITSGPFPRASTRSPWWLKGYPIAVSCCVKVKVFPAFHQWTFPFSPLPFSRECASLAALLAVYTKVAYSFIFSQFSLSSVPPVFFFFFKWYSFWGQHIKEPLLIAAAAAAKSLLLMHWEIRFHPLACINNLKAFYLMAIFDAT